MVKPHRFSVSQPPSDSLGNGATFKIKAVLIATILSGLVSLSLPAQAQSGSDDAAARKAADSVAAQFGRSDRNDRNRDQDRRRDNDRHRDWDNDRNGRNERDRWEREQHSGRDGRNWERDRDQRERYDRDRYDRDRYDRDRYDRDRYDRSWERRDEWSDRRGNWRYSRSNPNWWRGHPDFNDYRGHRNGYAYAPGYGYYRINGPYRRYHHGERLPRHMHVYRVRDPYLYGLPHPGYGQDYYYVGNDVVLVTVATGLILSVLLDAF